MLENKKMYILYLIAFVIWYFCIHTFYNKGNLQIGGDVQHVYLVLDYLQKSLERGVYPLWSPFNAWGRTDDFNARVVGDLNPFYSIIYILNAFGLSFSLSFFIFLIAYFVLGMIGYYHLAKSIFHDENSAFFAVNMLMFTTISTNLFSDVIVILLFVPLVWFFYFLVAFSNKHQRGDFLGLILTLGIMLITYIPFFSALTILLLIILFLIFYFRSMGQILRGYKRFILENKLLVVVSIVIVSLFLLPGWFWFSAIRQGDYVMGWRPTVNENASLEMSKIVINSGGLIGRSSMQNLISYQDMLNLGDFFVPIFGIIVLMISFIIPLVIRQILLFCFSFILLLIALGDVSPVYNFIYNHVEFMRTFRNLHFFLWFIVPIGILFVAGQFKFLLERKIFNRSSQILTIVFIILIHGLMAYFLYNQEHILLSAFWTVPFSCIFFVSLELGVFKKRNLLFYIVLLFLIVFQPIEVFSQFWTWTIDRLSFQYSKDPYTNEEFIPAFNFIRPTLESHQARRKFSGVEAVNDIQDTSGFINGRFHGMRWVHELQENVSKEELSEYVRYKFLLYDRIVQMDAKQIDYQTIGRDLGMLNNRAYIFDPQGLIMNQSLKNEQSAAKAFVIERENSQFQILKFDYNNLKFRSHYLSNKFLVYNDAYHKDWNIYVNNKPVKLFQSNVAFKGFLLPQGENEVSMVFRPFQEIFYKILFVLFHALLFYTLFEKLHEIKLRPKKLLRL